MVNNKTVSVVIPCFNEESNIKRVVEGIPEYVDQIIVIDDASQDGTLEILHDLAASNSKLKVVSHKENAGVGAAIATGYELSRISEVDVAVVIAGDGQMDTNIMGHLIWPILDDGIDYVKTNRLLYPNSFQDIPKIRFFGNFLLSLFTRVASGYWYISDSQSGYTAIGKRALQRISWANMYPRYGQPNDLLISLNIYNFKVLDLYAPPVYGVGEKSKLRIRRVAFTIPVILVKGFVRRLWKKYVLQQGHPLVLFYFTSFLSLLIGSIYLLKILVANFANGTVPQNSLIVMVSLLLLFFQSLSFAMLFDLQDNKDLNSSSSLEEMENKMPKFLL